MEYAPYKHQSVKRYALDYLKKDGLDLEFVTDKLKQCNVEVDQVNHDTFAEKNKFFSYRRSCKLKQKDYGRCISTIGILN